MREGGIRVGRQLHQFRARDVNPDMFAVWILGDGHPQWQCVNEYLKIFNLTSQFTIELNNLLLVLTMACNIDARPNVALKFSSRAVSRSAGVLHPPVFAIMAQQPILHRKWRPGLERAMVTIEK